MANYKTIKGARPYFLALAKDFKMSQDVIDKLNNAETISEIEHIWKEAIRTL